MLNARDVYVIMFHWTALLAHPCCPYASHCHRPTSGIIHVCYYMYASQSLEREINLVIIAILP